MTVHVLHAGDGYTYLTRQVAHGDVQLERGQAIGDYYAEKGAPPGQWLGTGTEALGMAGVVTEKHMLALFGEGLHPEAETLIQSAMDAGSAAEAAIRGAQLGRRYPAFDSTRQDQWRQDVGERYALLRAAPETAEVADRDLRAQARTHVGREWFVRDRGRAPVDQGELKQYVTRASKPTPQPVAGYDLVFTPVKSVSVLWGVADDDTRRIIQAAHKTAIADALGYLEQEATYTRAGAGGVRQVNARGLVAVAFDHYDSRAGDPNLHTHVAVANKVQGPDGKWRSLDGRVLHAAAVSASERYNSVLEREVVRHLGVAFEARETERGKRPVREVAGVDPRLTAAFSQRRDAIEDRYSQLLADYRRVHGKEPAKHVQHQLAQQATLDTRGAKEELESLAQKRAKWLERAHLTVGEQGLAELMPQVRAAAQGRAQQATPVRVEALAAGVVTTLASERSRWKTWHIKAEAERAVREIPGLDAAAARALVEEVVAHATTSESVLLEAPERQPVPAELAREDGQSVYRVHGAGWYSSTAVLSAEQRLLEAAAVPATALLDPEIFTAMIAARGTGLDEGQVELARHFATTEALLAVGVGPAGAGKTRAMGEFADLVRGVGGRVVAVAPSAVAAQGLGNDIRAEATTVAKLLHTAEVDGIEATGLAAGDVLLVDEAGMASTGDLDRLVALARATGSVVRLLGDPSQLSAVEAGGAFRLLVHRTPAAELTALHRFSDPAEAAASLALRAGNSDAVDFYEDTSRLHGGTRDGLLEQLYNDWTADQAAGLSSLMLAGDTATVRELSVRARLDRIAAGDVAQSGQRLHDGTTAGVGDRVVTRRNDRRLATAGGGDFVKNGDLWTVVETRPDGAMLVQHLERGGAPVLLPADYANTHVELGYALTVHRAQGMTVDVARSLVTDATTRETGYVAGTRGRHANHFYCVTEDVVDVDLHHPTADDQTPRQVMEAMLGRDAAERSAHETITDAFEAAESLAALIPEYDDARGAAAANTAHLDELLSTTFGHDQVTAMRNDPAWHALTARLGELDQADVDLQSLMPSVAGDLNDARNPAAVVAWRLEQRHPTRGLEQWLTAPAADHAHDRGQELVQIQERGWEPSGQPVDGRDSDPMSRWLGNHATRIRARIDELERRAHATQAPWLATLGDTPEADTPAAVAHREAVRAIAAYRERYAITSTNQPLGYEPTDGQQQNDWRTVNAIIEHRATVPHAAVTASSTVATADLLARFQDLTARSRNSPLPPRPQPDRTQQERLAREQAHRDYQERSDDLER